MFNYDYNKENPFLESDNEINKIMTNYNIINLEKSEKLSSVTERAILENSSDFELMEEYMSVISYYKEAEEGIFAKLIAWIRNIVDAILGRNNIAPEDKIPDNTPVEVKGDPKGFLSFIEDIVNKLDGLTKKPAGQLAANLLKIGGTLFAGKTAMDVINDKWDSKQNTMLNGKVVNYLIGKADTYSKKVKNFGHWLEDKIKEKLNIETDDSANIGLLRTLIDTATKGIDKAKSSLAEGYKNAKARLKGEKPKEKIVVPKSTEEIIDDYEKAMKELEAAYEDKHYEVAYKSKIEAAYKMIKEFDKFVKMNRQYTGKTVGIVTWLTGAINGGKFNKIESTANKTIQELENKINQQKGSSENDNKKSEDNKK